MLDANGDQVGKVRDVVIQNRSSRRSPKVKGLVVDLFAEIEVWRPTHVALADWADLLLTAPCTANVLAKLAHGLADDALTATALACRAPLVVAPAMNDGMWDHPATRANVRTLAARGATLVEVGAGDLACGTTGRGRLADLDAILDAVTAALPRAGRRRRPARLKGRR